MRREKDLGDKVNVHQRAIAAEGGVRSNGRLQTALHVPEPPGTAEVDSGDKELNLLSLFSGEMTLAAKTSTGEPAVVKVPHAFVGTIVVILLALVSGGYWLVSTLARLDANTATIMRQQERTFTHLETQKAYIDAQTGQVKFMQGLLNRDHQKALAEYQRANPMPAAPNLETARPDWMKEN